MIAHLNKHADFYDGVDKMVSGGSNYIDAIVEWCRIRDLEVEAVAPLVEKNPSLVAKLREEAEQLNFMTKTSRLPV